MKEFGLDNYLNLEAKQQPTWDSEILLEQVKQELAAQPPLVFAGEVDTLKKRIADAAKGEGFILQGGDCAETFADATADRIRNRIKTVLQMAVVLMYGSSLPVVKMGRMAGQFAKPRSSDTETRGDLTLPAYRGDAVNGYEFTPESRVNDPYRLMQAYNTSASTLNLIRAFTTGGFADLLGTGTADAVDALQTDPDMLLGWQVDTRDARHEAISENELSAVNRKV